MDVEQQRIDELLEHYLGLLDEYTQLRQSLSQVQSGVYQNIARANFSGERGMRYGQDHYDERMQAIRLLAIEVNEEEVPGFSIFDAPTEEPEKGQIDAPEETGQVPKQQVDDGSSKTTTQKNRKTNLNPLHWFGMFAPMPLRTAQTQSIQAVEHIIPKLVSINAEMLNVEIEVRRARKRRAKADAAAKREMEPAANSPQPSAALEAS